MTAEQWFASTDEERFSSGPYGSKSEAVEAFPVEYALGEGDLFFVCKADSYEVPSNPISACWVLESLSQLACDAVNDDVVDEWPASPGKEAEDELEEGIGKVIAAWLEKHGLIPSFFVGVDTSEHHAAQVEA